MTQEERLNLVFEEIASDVKDTQTAIDNHTHTGVYAPALGVDDNYVTDAEKIIIGNTSGINTGDYVHPTTEGNLHVPATGTSNEGRLLQAGASAGIYSWSDTDYREDAKTFVHKDDNAVPKSYMELNITGGIPTTVPWGIVFKGDDVATTPDQTYAQLFVNPTNTGVGSTTASFNFFSGGVNSVNIYDSRLKAIKPIEYVGYATGSLPLAASSSKYLTVDTTLNGLVYSDGEDWNELLTTKRLNGGTTGTATNAAPAFLQKINLGYVNPEWWGFAQSASGNTNKTALIAAFDEQKKVIQPRIAGVPNVTGFSYTLSSGQDLCWEGNGPLASSMNFHNGTSPTDGIEIITSATASQMQADKNSIEISGLGFQTMSEDTTKYGLKVVYPDATGEEYSASGTSVIRRFENLAFSGRGTSYNTQHWGKGLQLVNGTYMTIKNIIGRGAEGGYAGTLISLEGTHDSIANTIEGVWCANFYYGIYCSGKMEGLTIKNPTLLANYGIYIDAFLNLPSEQAQPQVVISDGHLDCLTQGIFLKDIRQANIHDLMIYLKGATVKGTKANFASLPSSGNTIRDQWELTDPTPHQYWIYDGQGSINGGWVRQADDGYTKGISMSHDVGVTTGVGHNNIHDVYMTNHQLTTGTKLIGIQMGAYTGQSNLHDQTFNGFTYGYDILANSEENYGQGNKYTNMLTGFTNVKENVEKVSINTINPFPSIDYRTGDDFYHTGDLDSNLRLTVDDGSDTVVSGIAWKIAFQGYSDTGDGVTSTGNLENFVTLSSNAVETSTGSSLYGDLRINCGAVLTTQFFQHKTVNNVPVEFQSYSTAGLPAESVYEGSMVYDSTVDALKFSDSTDWVSLLKSKSGNNRISFGGDYDPTGQYVHNVSYEVAGAALPSQNALLIARGRVASPDTAVSYAQTALFVEMHSNSVPIVGSSIWGNNRKTAAIVGEHRSYGATKGEINGGAFRAYSASVPVSSTPAERNLVGVSAVGSSNAGATAQAWSVFGANIIAHVGDTLTDASGGTAPSNCVGIEVDLIHSIGPATITTTPSAGSNFTGLWVQSDASNVRSSAGLYISARNVGTAGYSKGYNYGIYTSTYFGHWIAYLDNTENLPASKGLLVGIRSTSTTARVLQLQSNGVECLRVVGSASHCPLSIRVGTNATTNGSLKNVRYKLAGTGGASLTATDKVLIAV